METSSLTWGLTHRVILDLARLTILTITFIVLFAKCDLLVWNIWFYWCCCVLSLLSIWMLSSLRLYSVEPLWTFSCWADKQEWLAGTEGTTQFDKLTWLAYQLTSTPLNVCISVSPWHFPTTFILAILMVRGGSSWGFNYPFPGD